MNDNDEALQLWKEFMLCADLPVTEQRETMAKIVTKAVKLIGAEAEPAMAFMQ